MKAPQRPLSSYSAASNQHLFLLLLRWAGQLAWVAATPSTEALAASLDFKRTEALSGLDRLHAEVRYRAELDAYMEQAPKGTPDALCNDLIKEIVWEEGGVWFTANMYTALAHVIAASRAANALVADLDGAGVVLTPEETAHLRTSLTK